ncbi:hypothetical protein PV783_11660 [Chitinophaga sp. CC14]|uniref:hypothetical protein n=1 Tax=Chitinophaga sp. CC14 TaxID=3029199 RepID=UPI003B825F05
MKKLISFLVILLLPFLVKAQDPQPVYGDYIYPGSVLFDNGLYIPVRDTTGFAPYRVGALVILPQDTVGHPATPPIRFWNGNYWGSIVGGAGNIYFGNNGVHLAGNTFQLGDSLNHNTDIKTKGYAFSLNGTVKAAPLFRLSNDKQEIGFTELDSTESGYIYVPNGKQGEFRFYAKGVPVGMLKQGSFQLNDSSLNNYFSSGKDFLTLTGSTGSAYAEVSPGSTILSTTSGSPYAVFNNLFAQLPPLANTNASKYLSVDATGKLFLNTPSGITALDSLRYDPSTGIFYGRYTTGGEFPVPTGLVDSLKYRAKLDTGQAQYLAIFKTDSAIGISDIRYSPSPRPEFHGLKEYIIGSKPFTTRSAKLMITDTMVVDSGYHSIGDYSYVTQSASTSGGSAFAVMDIATVFGGSKNWSHLYGVQSRPTFSGSGNITDFYALQALLQHTGTGVLTNGVSLMVEDIVGSGPTTNQFGVYIRPQTKGINKWAIYSPGNTVSYIAGNVGIGVTNPTVPLAVSGAVTAGSITSSGIVTVTGTAPQITFSETDNTAPLLRLLFNDSTFFVDRSRDNMNLFSIRTRDAFASFTGPVQSNHSFTVNSAAPFFRFKNTSLSNKDYRIVSETGDLSFQKMNTDSTNIANILTLKNTGAVTIATSPVIGSTSDTILVRGASGDIKGLTTASFVLSGSTAYVSNQTATDKAESFRISGSGIWNASPYTSSIRSNLISSNYRAGFNTETNGSYNYAISSAPTASPVFRWLFKQTTAVDYTVDTDELMRLTGAGNLGVGNNAPTARGDFSSSTGYNQLRLRTSYTPTSSADANGNTGDVSWDANYIYIKTAAGWKRSALTTF